MSVTRLQFWLTDPSGKEASTSFWLPDGLSLADVESVANGFRSVLLPVTNARLERATYSVDFVFTDDVTAPPEADVRRRLLVFFTNGTKVRSISVPSPSQLPFDTTGPYIGIRLQRSSILLSPVLTSLETIPTIVVDVDGTAFPTDFSVAGITRI